METFCEKKILEKLTGEKLQGVATTPPPLGRLRDNYYLNALLRISAMHKDTRL